MKAFIIGGCTEGIASALKLKSNGYDVTIAVDSTYLGEDFTGTWRYLPKCGQAEGIRQLRERLGIELPDGMPLLNGWLKQTLCKTVLDAGIEIRYMTRPAGIEHISGTITGVMLASKLGCETLPCDVVIDATLGRRFAAMLCGRKPIISKGSKISLTFEYYNAINDGTLQDGVLEDGQAFYMVEETCLKDTEYETARSSLMQKAISNLKQIHKRHMNAKLQNGFAPMIDTDHCSSARPEYINFGFADDVETIEPGIDKSGENERVFFGSNGKPDEIETDLLVVGAGTAGMRAALAAAGSGQSVILAEFFGTLGGTRTVGGIQSPYYGNRNTLFLSMWNEINTFARETGGYDNGKTSAASEALLYENKVKTAGIICVRPAIAYDVRKHGRNIEGVLFATETGAVLIKAKMIIDATGDGDIAYFAGVKTCYGSDEIGLTQNYSQSQRWSGTKFDKFLPDQDIVDINSRTDMTRALNYDNLTCANYDMVEMLTVRESRRIYGRNKITVSDIFSGKRDETVVYDAMSDYDTHSRCFNSIARYGVMPMHSPIKFVAVPYGALLPQGVDNLFVCGKAISASQEAVAFLRMCPDIMCVGYIAGKLASKAFTENLTPEQVSLKEIQAEMLACGGLIKPVPATAEVTETTNMLAMRIAAGEEEALTNALITKRYDLLQKLQTLKMFNALTPKLLPDEIMMYYGDTNAAARIADALSQLTKAHCSDCHSEYINTRLMCGGNTYIDDSFWQINLLVMLIAKNGMTEYAPLIIDVMRNSAMGEEWYNQPDAFMKLRPDRHTHGGFDRMLCLAEAACLMPVKEFAPELDRLIDHNRTAYGTDTAYVNDWLFIKLAEAAYRCGSDKGRLLLEEYRGSKYSIFRKYALRILT